MTKIQDIAYYTAAPQQHFFVVVVLKKRKKKNSLDSHGLENVSKRVSKNIFKILI